jgi:hypothetical protein
MHRVRGPFCRRVQVSPSEEGAGLFSLKIEIADVEKYTDSWGYAPWAEAAVHLRGRMGNLLKERPARRGRRNDLMTTKIAMSGVMARVTAAGLAVGLGCGMALAQGAGQDMKDAGHATKDAAVDAGHATKTAAVDTAHGTKKVYHKTAAGTKTVAHKTAHGTDVAADKTAHGAKVAGHDTKVGAKKVGHGTKVAAKDTAHGTENLGDKVAGKPETH